MENFDQSQFDELYEMVQENNEMLRTQHRTFRLQSLGRIIKIIILIALFIGAVVFVRPYIQNAKKIYDSVSENITKLNTTAQSVTEQKETVQDFFGGFSDEFDEVGLFFDSLKKNKTVEVEG